MDNVSNYESHFFTDSHTHQPGSSSLLNKLSPSRSSQDRMLAYIQDYFIVSPGNFFSDKVFQVFSNNTVILLLYEPSTVNGDK